MGNIWNGLCHIIPWKWYQFRKDMQSMKHLRAITVCQDQYLTLDRHSSRIKRKFRRRNQTAGTAILIWTSSGPGFDLPSSLTPHWRRSFWNQKISNILGRSSNRSLDWSYILMKNQQQLKKSPRNSIGVTESSTDLSATWTSFSLGNLIRRSIVFKQKDPLGDVSVYPF